MGVYYCKASPLILYLVFVFFGHVSSVTIRVPSNVDSSAPESLQQQLCNEGVSSNTELVLEAGQHFVDAAWPCVLSDLSNITITSEGKARIVCSAALEGHNFIFLNISELLLENIEMIGCGRALPQTLPSYVNSTFCYIGSRQKAAIVVSHVTNLCVTAVTFSGSFGYSILAVNLRGDTRFIDMTITYTDNYRHPKCYGNESDVSCSGAGAAFIYSDTNMDESNFNSSSLTLSNCTITNNTNFIPLRLFIPIFINVRSSFEPQDILLTGGTGLALYFGQKTYLIPVKIEYCNISHNTGYSSAMVVVTHSTLRQNVIDIDGCVIESNKGNDLARGGALIALIITYLSDFGSFPEFPPDIFKMFIVRNSLFRRNSAPIGGSMYFYISPQNLTALGIIFDNVQFIENEAEVGSAFEVNTRQATFKQRAISILMKDVTAKGNLFGTSRSDTVSSSNIVENSAAFVFTRVFNITVYGSSDTHKCVFSHNSPGAFLVLGGNFYMKGHIEFLENRALRGGAISLYDYALLFFHEDTKINFTRNMAIEVGGAIYANSLGTGTAPTCVFQVIGPNRINSSGDVAILKLSLRFMNNSANQGGNSIYVNPLYNCAYLPESSLVDTSVFYDARIVYNSIFTFEDSVGNGLRELSSTPERLCYCSDGDVKTSATECNNVASVSVVLYPGQELTISAFPTDLNFNPVSAVVFAELKSKEHALKPGQYTQQLNGVNCTAMRFNILGEGNATTSLSLYTRLGASRLMMDVHLLECPPGFLPSGDDKTCICDPYVTETIRSTCDFGNYTISRIPNLWLGVMEHEDSSDVVYIPTCPTGFCQSNITSVDLTVNDQLCFEGRTGILCGACKGNLSVVFGSPFCMECSHFWLFTILLYGLAGIVLVAILFALELTVTHGTLTTVIFYANIVGVNSNIFFPVNQRGLLFAWISILNLELGFPLCFYHGMNEAAKSGLQAIFPLYLLFICLTIIFLSERSNRVAKWTSSHGVQVLATTVYLSFSKMLRYVIDILTVVNLYSEKKSRHVWFYDGNLGFFRSSHVIIALIPALPTLLFIIGFTLAMLFIKQIEQRNSKLKPFLDVYGGPFKDKYRYWFGLRLVILAGMCLSFAVLGTNLPVLALTIQLVILCLFMVLQAIAWPYRKNVINLTDLAFMVNFFIMGIFIIEAHQSSLQSVFENKLKTIVIALGSIALFHFVLILLWYIIKAIYRIGCVKARLKPHVEKFRSTTLPALLQKFERFQPASTHSKLVSVEANVVKLKSMSSVATDNGQVTNSTLISSTDVSLGNAVNADSIEKMLSRKVTYSHYRESIIED